MAWNKTQQSKIAADIFMCMCMCLCMCGDMPEEDTGSPGIRVAGCCGLPDVGSVQGSSGRTTVLLITEWSPHPQGENFWKKNKFWSTNQIEFLAKRLSLLMSLWKSLTNCCSWERTMHENELISFFLKYPKKRFINSNHTA